MELKEAVKIFENKTKTKVKEYLEIENGWFFIIETKPGFIQNAFYILSNNGNVKSGIEEYYEMTEKELLSIKNI